MSGAAKDPEDVDPEEGEEEAGPEGEGEEEEEGSGEEEVHELTLERQTDGGLLLRGVPLWLYVTLLEIPALLDPDQPEEVKRRLYPEPGDDPALKEEWIRLVHPELFATVASAREIVERDLKAMEATGESFSLLIPPSHVHGWISALNAARLTLAEKFGIGEAEMAERHAPTLEGARALALIKIDVLAWIQQVLIEGAA